MTLLDRALAAFPAFALSREQVLVCATVGSHSFGTYTPSTDPNAIDDIDIMCVVVPPPQETLGLHTFDHWCPPVGNHGELDLVFYSAKKFAGLLLKNNPNVLGMLWMPERCILHADPLWECWVAQRSAIVSKLALTSFAGYADGQLRRLGHPNTRGYMGRERKALFERFGFDIKNASHLVRLLRMGTELAETGNLNVDRTEIDRDELLCIKRGEWSLRQIEIEADRQFARLRAAGTTLADRPDDEALNDLLLATTQAMWSRVLTQG